MMPTMSKKPATFHIEERALDELREVAAELEVSSAMIVRVALDVALSRIRASVDKGASGLAALGELEALKNTD